MTQGSKIQDFRVGQIVRLADPQDLDELTELFAVVELRGERVVVQLVGFTDGPKRDYSIVPQFAYLASDLIAV